MTLCPVAMAVGCKKCPAVSFCMLKSFIGDYQAPETRKMQATSAKTKSTTGNPRKKKKA